MEHANWFALLLVVGCSATIVTTILRARSGKELFIRRIPGLSAMDEAVGRATEMGRPMLFVTGLGGVDVISLQALAVAQYVGRMAAKYGSRLIVPVVDPMVMTIAREVTRDAWRAEGREDAYRPDDVRFLSGEQFPYAAGVIGLMNREKVASTFFFGYFYGEALLLSESGFEVGAVQVAATPATTQIPFFLMSCDYTVIGDEYYAATAYLTREPNLLGSLVGQDLAKAAIVGLIVLGTVLAMIQGKEHLLMKWLGG